MRQFGNGTYLGLSLILFGLTSTIHDYFDEEADDMPCFSGWTKYSSLFHLVQPPGPQSSMVM